MYPNYVFFFFCWPSTGSPVHCAYTGRLFTYLCIKGVLHEFHALKEGALDPAPLVDGGLGPVIEGHDLPYRLLRVAHGVLHVQLGVPEDVFCTELKLSVLEMQRTERFRCANYRLGTKKKTIWNDHQRGGSRGGGVVQPHKIIKRGGNVAHVRTNEGPPPPSFFLEIVSPPLLWRYSQVLT